MKAAYARKEQQKILQFIWRKLIFHELPSNRFYASEVWTTFLDYRDMSIFAIYDLHYISLPKLEVNDSQRQDYCYPQKSDIIKLYQWINHTMGTRDKISKWKC